MPTILEAHGSFQGKHFWPDGIVAGFPDLQELHPHTFNVRIWFVVEGDREIEFITFGAAWADWLGRELRSNSGWSCETMAAMLLKRLKEGYDRDFLAVRVQEDDGGAAIVYDQEQLLPALLIGEGRLRK